MFRLLLPALSLLMVLCPSSTYAASQQANNLRLNPLLERVEVSLQAHQALVEQLHLDQETLLALGSAAGDDLQPIYVATSKNYRDSVEAAVSVSSAIAGVNQTAITLFEEWRDEIGYLTDARIKASNETQFAGDWQSYQDLIKALQRSEAMVDPVLAELKSNVVYFKQTLDQSSVVSRKADLENTNKSIEALIDALAAAITRSNAFLSAMQ